MLITSRGTGRWVVPKGNPIKGLEPHRAAAHEAFEEAGVSGIACPTAIGHFHYAKRLKNGRTRTARVDVFPLSFLSQADEWPEQDERQFRWFNLPDAAAAVDEPDLKTIIAGFRAPDMTAGAGTRALLWLRRQSSEKIPMLRWFQALMPKQGRFFELFEEHAATLVAGADALARLLEGGNVAAHADEIVAREHEADEITREVLQDVRRTFVTPFDRSAITDLIGSMDDAIDQMHQTAKAITLFEVAEFRPHMRDMAGIIVEAARITAEAIPLLRSLGQNAARLHELTERLVQIEGHADEIYDAGLKALFKADGVQAAPMQFIIGREIYAHLEKIVDRFEDVANEIQGLVIDHA